MRPIALLLLTFLLASFAFAQSPATKDMMLSHDVFFTLKDKTPANQQALVAACQKYLKNHAGIVFFSAGVLATDLTRDVNDLGFDVALHIVFKTKADQDRYQTHPQHLKFIEENQKLWAKVRVFDSYVK
jgi:hypothetical protein